MKRQCAGFSLLNKLCLKIFIINIVISRQNKQTTKCKLKTLYDEPKSFSMKCYIHWKNIDNIKKNSKIH